MNTTDKFHGNYANGWTHCLTFLFFHTNQTESPWHKHQCLPVLILVRVIMHHNCSKADRPHYHTHHKCLLLNHNHSRYMRRELFILPAHIPSQHGEYNTESVQLWGLAHSDKFYHKDVRRRHASDLQLHFFYFLPGFHRLDKLPSSVSTHFKEMTTEKQKT